MEKNKVMYKMNHYLEPVLIVEDKIENQILLEGLCKKIGVQYEVAENGSIALEKGKNKKFSIHIVDLMMPVMDGRTYIVELKKINPDAVILVQTALDSAETIINIMKMGVFDYIIKPIDPEVFIQTFLKAIEYNYLKEFEKEQALNAGKKIRSQIEWLNYKENRRISEKEFSETKSVYSLKSSLAQGAGFGTLITLIDLLSTCKKEKGSVYEMDKDVIDIIIENNEYCRLQMEGLNYATEIMEKEYVLSRISSFEFLNELPSMLKRIYPFLKEKNIELTLPELSDSCFFKIDKEIVSIVVEELVVNAYKFALSGTKINIICHISDGYFWFSVKNEVKINPYGGVPKEYEKLVIEPFYRIGQPDESVLKADRIGFGLGLAVVDYVIKRHYGIFLIHDVLDHTDFNKEESKPCVLAELLFPITD